MAFNTEKIYKLVSNYNKLSAEVTELRLRCVYNHDSTMLVDSLNGQEAQINGEMGELFEKLVAETGSEKLAFNFLEGKSIC